MIKDICYATDDNYAPLVGVSIISMIRCNSEIKNQLCFHIVCNNVAPENIRRLEMLGSQFDVKILTYEVNLEEYMERKNPESTWPLTTYARIFLDSILDRAIEQVLYIDCDTIIVDDIVDLLSTDLKDNVIIAGAEDINSKQQLERLGISPHNIYINAGVLLIDLKKWRRKGISEILLNQYYEEKEEYMFCDQDLINLTCQDYLDGSIEYRYNAGGLDYFWPSYFTEKNIAIIHYWGTEYRTRRKDLMSLFCKLYDQSPWTGMTLLDNSTLSAKVRARIKGWLALNCKPMYKLCLSVWMAIRRDK